MCFRPIFHSLYILVLFFLAVFLIIHCTLPFSHLFTSHAPHDYNAVMNIPTPIPSSSISSCLDTIPLSLLTRIHTKRNQGLTTPNNNISLLVSVLLLLSGDIQLNPGPSPTSIQFAHLNSRSISSVTPDLDKPTLLQEFIADENIEIFALSETWLPTSPLPSTLTSITPPNFTLIHCPRPVGKGGGVAFIYRSYLKIIKVTIPIYSTFEALCIRLTIASSSITFLTIYRPPSSSLPLFISEFSSLIDKLIVYTPELVISGDFNIHFDSATDSSTFRSFLNSYHLTQHVHFPTHKYGHILDYIITKSDSTIISSVDWTIPFISDHYTVHCAITVPSHRRPPITTKLTRAFRSIDIESFSNDITASDLYSTTPTSLDTYLSLFNTTLISLVDKHAPLKSTKCSSKTSKPFITKDILKEKQKRSKLESIYRKTKFTSDLTKFKAQSRLVSKMITTSRRTYFRSMITQHKDKPRQLWSTLNTLLSRKSLPCLPNCASLSDIASSFLLFFDGKISKLCSNFSTATPLVNTLHSEPSSPPPILSTLSPATHEEVLHAIMSASNATCALDIIPTFLLKACIQALLPPITELINLCLDSGSFPRLYKHALVTPLLKKYNLPTDDLSSYRPISNLNFISKILERIIHSRLTSHLDSFPSITPFQSAYRHYHSTETALLRIQNDLLLSINEQKVSALVLLDLSAAFDTIDHTILLNRLSSFYGISGSALDMLSSYLNNRTQSVSINGTTTPPSPTITGVPQGSVLGPLLFTLYTSPLSQIFSSSPVSFHLYADDTQLYISFSASDAHSNLSMLSSTLETVHFWLTFNRLTVNPSKTEFLIIGTPQQRCKLQAPTISFQNTPILPSPSARNLGVIFDSDLSLTKHISSICQASYLQIRQLKQIRSVLDTNTAIILANSLVSSKLDYCNSLFHNLPDSSIDRLQRIQNSLARIVMPFVKRFDHITPALQKLHWLPIRQRITFKIATLTFKTLQSGQPSYLSDLLHRNIPTRTLRSSHQNLLQIPFVKSAAGRRAFAFAAPTVWNSLPPTLRSATTLSNFRANLKTYLFPKLPP